MRKAAVSSVVPLAITAGLLLGACEHAGAHRAPEVPQVRPAAASPNFEPGTEAQLQKDTTAAARWAGLGTPRLVLLQGNEHVSTPYMDADTTTAPVFVENDKTVYVGAQALNGMFDTLEVHSPEREQALEDFMIFHEFGHDWQHEHNISLTPPTGEDLIQQSAYRQQIELQADCRAGAAMEVLAPTEVTAVTGTLSTAPADGQHPAGPQRADSFMHGVRTGAC